MKKRLLILPLLAGFALSSCSIQDLMFWKKKEEQPSGEQTPSASVTSVTISGAKTSLVLGETMQLTASVTVTGDAAKTVTWSTSAAAKATVSSSGLVTAKGLGEVTVTATSTADSSKSASVTFTVASPTWSATTKALFEEYFEDVPPAFIVPSSLTWTDDWFEDYSCICAEGSGNSVSTVTANIEATGAYKKVSTSSSTSTDYTAPSADPDYEWYIQVYYQDSTTSIDVYMYPVEYSAWPSEVVAAHLTKLEFTTAEIPVFSSEEELVYTCVYEKLESGEEVVFINVYGEAQAEEPDLTSVDYVTLFNSEKYDVYEIDGGYQIQAKDKSHSVIVYNQEIGIDWSTWSYVYYPGFQVIVAPYIPNYEIDIDEQYEMIEVGDSLDLTLVKGEDVPSEAVITFTSSDSGIASIDANTGHVEGVAAGSATITATYAAQEVTATTIVYVVESIPTAFSAEQLAEFDKIHGEGVVSAPFNKYFESVSFSEEEVVEVSGKEVSHEIIESYYLELIADGWVDENEYMYEIYVEYEYAASVEEAREMCFAYSGKYELSKTFADQYVVYGDLYATAYDEEEEAEGLAFDGNIHFDVYDVFVYTYEEALDEFEAVLTDFGYETLPTFPEALPASRFAIDSDNYGVDFYAFDTEVTLELLKTALEGKGFSCEIIEETEEVYEDSEEEPEVTKVLYASALEGEFELSAVYYEDEEVLVMHVDKKASGHWADTLADLKDGDEFCIFSYGYGLGSYDSSKKLFNYVEAVDENNYYDPDTEGLLHLFLEKGEGDVWYIKDAEGNYYGADASKNVVVETASTKSEWTIAFDEDTYAIFSCGGFDLYFNSQAPRFDFYAPGMSTGESYYVYVYEN